MKTQIYRAFLSLSGLAAIGLFAGCATQPKDVSANLGVESYAGDVVSAQRQLDRTIESLHELINSPENQLQANFSLFSTNLAQLQTATYDFRQAARTMELRGQNYFENWDRELARMDDDDIREASEDRRESVLEGYSRASALYNESANDLASLVSDLQDVRGHLEADLSKAGIDVIEDSIDEIYEDSSELSSMLSDLDKRFEALGVEYPRGMTAGNSSL